MSDDKQLLPTKPLPPCNLCGEACAAPHHADNALSPMGLINCTVSGGYDSTPGNGCGALDDSTSYTFSLCEWCLDWLFAQFKHPPTTSDYISPGEDVNPWRPAEERVYLDEWRSQKKEFYAELLRRNAARASLIVRKP